MTSPCSLVQPLPHPHHPHSLLTSPSPCGMQKGLLSEVRPVIAARDLDRFNELTVHAEIAARNVSS